MMPTSLSNLFSLACILCVCKLKSSSEGEQKTKLITHTHITWRWHETRKKWNYFFLCAALSSCVISSHCLTTEGKLWLHFCVYEAPLTLALSTATCLLDFIFFHLSYYIFSLMCLTTPQQWMCLENIRSRLSQQASQLALFLRASIISLIDIWINFRSRLYNTRRRRARERERTSQRNEKKFFN